MTAQPLETRLARMEGINVQIADRLNSMDRHIESIESGLRSEIGSVRGEVGSLRGEVDGLRSDMNVRFAQVDQKFLWLIGINMTSWTTIMLAVLFHR